MRRRWEDEVRLGDLRPGVTALWGSWTLHRPAPDLADLVAGLIPDTRHLLAIWEPILTHAPSPARCQPYCCYSRSVIFYARPYISRPGRPWRGMDGVLRAGEGKIFVEYDHAGTRLMHDDVVGFAGEEWVIGGGHVVWHRRRWWMRRWARRREASR